MNLYPALQASMGSWKYYIVKMKMREIANDIRFATEVYDDRTLDEAIQRELSESRVKKDIVGFLKGRKDRFFASIVVAAIGGTPKFYSVKITDDPQFAVFADQDLDEAFGVLTFSGEQHYYALDGQHRLKAIKTLLDRTDPLSEGCPEGFAEEELSVLVVIKRDESMVDFLKSYRRLFSSLNRYAKRTDEDTNIIMDEDDTFAIITRQLISEHPFFKWTGPKERESARVKTKGKNLNANDPHFTSLQTLYAMNEELLSSSWRKNDGWGPPEDRHKDVREFVRFRPRSEQYVDTCYAELTVYWDALLEALPLLKDEPPQKHRDHGADLEEQKKKGLRDDLVFWPIGQELLAKVARRLLDKRQPAERVKDPTPASARDALLRLGKVSWELHKAPWRYLLITSRDASWRMRNEERKEALAEAELLLRWILGLDDLTVQDLKERKAKWSKLLVPEPKPEELEEMWQDILKMRDKCIGV